MTTKTTNLKLTTYNIVTDGSSLVATYMGDTAGSLLGNNPHTEDDYAILSSGSINRLTGSAITLTDSAVTLNTQVFGNVLSSGSYNQFETDSFGKIISASIVANVAGYSVMTNKSGSNLTKGTVCIYKPDTESSFTVSEYYGSPDVCGVLLQDCNANMPAAVAKFGTMPVRISGCIVRGNWLIVNGNPIGTAVDFMSGSYVSGSTIPLYGGVGVALQNVVSGSSFSGSVMVDVNIKPIRSGSGLRFLSTSTFLNPSGRSTTDDYYCDYGTDLMVVRTVNDGGIEHLSYAEKGLPIITDASDDALRHAQTYILQYPRFGLNKIAVRGTNVASKRLFVTNFAGNIVTRSGSPLRWVIDSATSSTPTSVLKIVPTSPGDILLDVVACASSSWTPTEAEQILEYFVNTDPYGYFSWRPASSGSETRMGWQGSAAKVCHAVLVVAGAYTEKGAY
jgi:hypothetical protein